MISIPELLQVPDLDDLRRRASGANSSNDVTLVADLLKAIDALERQSDRRLTSMNVKSRSIVNIGHHLAHVVFDRDCLRNENEALRRRVEELES